MCFEKTVKDIRSLKIQGAENVAKEAVKSLLFVVDKKNSKEKNIASLMHAKEILFKTRPTEPCMRNAINFALIGLSDSSVSDIYSFIQVRIKKTLDFFNESEEKIVGFGSEKIKDCSVIYTHCHSSTVVRVMLESWKNGMYFEVHNTETRPLFQGRVTSVELAREGISVFHYPDSAAAYALRKSDIVLFGADAITVEGNVFNKVGSGMFACIAKSLNIPVYICANSWKFDPKTVLGFSETVEKRSAFEVWKGVPKNVIVENFAFEKIDSENIAGIITEFGIYPPESLVGLMKKRYPWMFV